MVRHCRHNAAIGMDASASFEQGFRAWLRHAGRASAELQGAVFGVKESAMCCPGMARTASQAYVELQRAEQELAGAGHGVVHDRRPLTDAANRIEDAMHILRPLAELSSEEKLEVEGPYSAEVVESVQSSTRQKEARHAAAFPLFPAALAAPTAQSLVGWAATGCVAEFL
mmetsp:Transcript_57602/g.134107  ORF Transcript_57602/g.134107 Transcript_57602/m.134107 type:complete len:170 (+) Transcript_57602:49-558(+)